MRVCADPDNPPFSQRDGSGFENRIAQLLADELQRPLDTTWLRDRRGFVRKTLLAGRCDVVIGLPPGLPAVATTRPYYRSAFYFVTPRGEPALRRFDDKRLHGRRVGVQLIGIDPGTSPAGLALARHAPSARVVGYTAASDDRPPAQRMVQAIAEGRLDTAVLWGPQAGSWVRDAALRIERAEPPADMAALPFEFDIALAVRPADVELRQALDRALLQRRGDIDALLARYAVPRTDTAEAAP
ncbi:MAG: quinoprotein dehydrogenase-associated putative ABC transporter substrate-binding protein [Rubrivivax sp.]|nr:MAG: quinoprotein dehydrogenase-associated putative ABC transporter substrate-binding protein [Rubrivivax sp.]